MPSYRMKDTKGDERDVSCSISEMLEMKSNGWEVVFVPNSNSIISGRSTSGHGGGHGTSDMWKDTLRRIKANNPGSTIDV